MNEKKYISGIISFCVVAAAIMGYFNIKPVGPIVRKYFFQAKYQVDKAVAAPAPRAPGNTGAASTCRHNLRQIQSAKAKLASTRAIGNMSWTEIEKETGVRRGSFRCPSGGDYILGSQSIAVRCTVGDNGTPSTADDHRL